MLGAPSLIQFAHAFGQRYDLPIPLWIFVFGGAAVVLASFALIARTATGKPAPVVADETHLSALKPVTAAISFAALIALVLYGTLGSQEVAENIVPTIFWLLVWIVVPLSCGILGDWTQSLNPFAGIARLTGRASFRQKILARTLPLPWPAKLGWWAAAVLYAALACGELIFNQTAVLPAFTAWALAVYFVASTLMGLLFGEAWLRKGEVFTVLFSTWGRLGYWRFGAGGSKGFAGGLRIPFEASASRVAFVLMLLVSVNFDGLLATHAWTKVSDRYAASAGSGSALFHVYIVCTFLAVILVIWALFAGFARASALAAQFKLGRYAALAGLLPSLLPIAFGYLLAHNLEYIIVNGQLLFPLIGNPAGAENWPLHLPYPFNDSYEPRTHLLPSGFYWYVAVAAIIAVHVVAVLLAHRHLARSTRKAYAGRAEYPWLAAMVAYTMFSLWLLAQPLVQERAVAGEAGMVTPGVTQPATDPGKNT
ncbi:MAG TPA: hypothetical protein VLF59_01435 [Candidatus Saccharimonadales bacterium]|nr:hypothetical protein [Candidatus Saccharimonadales bacterium]